ncbi:SET domain-containing protein [Clavulina sp. PMI_390]|nr:SET domain-containing protein [Clavulina sp. PMI_390]
MLTSSMFLSLFDWALNEDKSPPAPKLVEVRDDAGPRGLFAKCDIAPASELLKVPGSRLLNRFTIQQSIPDSLIWEMSSTQLISFFIAHDGLGDKSWSLFFASLPANFDEHPLSWALGLSGVHGERCLSLLPRVTQQAVRSLVGRFQTDLVVLKAREVLLGLSPVELRQWAWAWLNVNTRCIYLDVQPSGGIEENLTLVPGVDFANHTVDRDQSCTFAFTYKHEARADDFGKPVAPTSGVLTSPAGRPVTAGDELFLQYGTHSSSYLMQEYGFCIPRAAMSDPGEVTLDTYLETLLLSRCEAFRDVLERWGYWGDWKLHLSPEPSVSYRTAVVCRLLHVSDIRGIANDTESSAWDPQIEPNYEQDGESYNRWKACVLGYVDDVSARNEQEVRKSLVSLCTQIIGDAEKHLARIQASAPDRPLQTPDWVAYSNRCISDLWQEQFDVASIVRDHLESGEAF